MTTQRTLIELAEAVAAEIAEKGALQCLRCGMLLVAPSALTRKCHWQAHQMEISEDMPGSRVYYARCGDLVKIGRSTGVSLRMAQLNISDRWPRSRAAPRGRLGGTSSSPTCGYTASGSGWMSGCTRTLRGCGRCRTAHRLTGSFHRWTKSGVRLGGYRR